MSTTTEFYVGEIFNGSPSPDNIIAVPNIWVFPLQKPELLNGKEYRHAVKYLQPPYNKHDIESIEKLCTQENGPPCAPNDWLGFLFEPQETLSTYNQASCLRYNKVLSLKKAAEKENAKQSKRKTSTRNGQQNQSVITNIPVITNLPNSSETSYNAQQQNISRRLNVLSTQHDPTLQSAHNLSLNQSVINIPGISNLQTVCETSFNAQHQNTSRCLNVLSMQQDPSLQSGHDLYLNLDYSHDKLQFDETVQNQENVLNVNATGSPNQAQLERPSSFNISSSSVPASTNITYTKPSSSTVSLLSTHEYSTDLSFPPTKYKKTDYTSVNDEVAADLKTLLADCKKGFDDMGNEFKKVHSILGEVKEELTSLKRTVKKLEETVDDKHKATKEVLTEMQNLKIMVNSVLKEKNADFLSVEEFNQKYKVELPFKFKDHFTEFDAKIENDEDLKTDLKKMIENSLVSNESLTENIKRVLLLFLSLDVIDLYNAVKKSDKSQLNKLPESLKEIGGRDKFIATSLSKYLQICIHNSFGENGDLKQYTSVLKTTFANSRLWGNRRSGQRQNLSNNSEEE